MFETIHKVNGETVFNAVLASIKTLAGASFKDKEPFIYNDGKKNIACVVLNDSITFLYNG